MINSWMIYGIIVLGNIGILLSLFGCFLIILGIIIIMLWFMEKNSYKGDEENAAYWQSKFKPLVIVTIIVWLLAALCPSTKEMAAIYLIPKIANNQHIQNIPDKALTALGGKLDEWINDQTKDRKK